MSLSAGDQLGPYEILANSLLVTTGEKTNWAANNRAICTADRIAVEMCSRSQTSPLVGTQIICPRGHYDPGVASLEMIVTFPGFDALYLRGVLDKMKTFLFLLVLLSIESASSQQMPGLETGKAAPAIRARDQFGKEQTTASLMGPKGLVLLFFRSSDW
jgi:hypothetical protein